MPTAKKAPPMHLWWVRHPECGLAIVNAPSWEQATIEAAQWWDVPWKEVAALCECERQETVPRHVCICCGKIFNGDGFRCTKCEIIERDKRLNQRACKQSSKKGQISPQSIPVLGRGFATKYTSGKVS